MLEILSLLAIGFLFGLRHAFDADHIAAVSCLWGKTTFSPTVARFARPLSLLRSDWEPTRPNPRSFVYLKIALQLGIYWGLGHTAVLFLIGIVVLLSGLHFPPAVSFWAEKGVAFVLIFYATHIFWRFFHSRKIHDGDVIHNHPPAGLHIHKNPSFWIGALHGLAGSAAIFVLIISTIKSTLLALFYILIFGIGSIVGMSILSLGIGYIAMRYKKYTGLATGIFSCITAVFLLFLP